MAVPVGERPAMVLPALAAGASFCWVKGVRPTLVAARRGRRSALKKRGRRLGAGDALVGLRFEAEGGDGDAAVSAR